MNFSLQTSHLMDNAQYPSQFSEIELCFSRIRELDHCPPKMQIVPSPPSLLPHLLLIHPSIAPLGRSTRPSTNPALYWLQPITPQHGSIYKQARESPHQGTYIYSIPPSSISIFLIQDRIRLCDGLNPLFGSTVAAAGNGRCVFILGDKSVPYPCPWSSYRNPERFRSNYDPTVQITRRTAWIT